MAHSPARANPDCDGGHGSGTALGRSRGRNPERRRGLDSARSEALARGRAEQFGGSHCHRGTAQRQDGRLDGEGQRRTVQRGGSCTGSEQWPRRKAQALSRTDRRLCPKLAELTDDVLYGDVWERPQLSKRDRSLVTVAALIALNRPEQLRSHFMRARENGVTQEELVETITHLAFYCGWPNAINALNVAKEVFEKK